MAGNRRDARILIVTTGATEWCQQQRLVGSTDLPMSAAGVRSMRAAAEKMGSEQLGLVLCGPDEGSELAAEVIGAATGGRVRSLEGLRNPCLGLWEGLSVQDASDKFAKSYRRWCSDPASVLPPEGEAFDDAEARILGTIAKAVLKHKADTPIGIVLRPAASAIFRCWLESLPSERVGWMIERSQPTEWRSVPRSRFEAVRSTLKTAI